jgi:exopolysaccharide biosynthesis polyprenyl glycosylphosphotransferase
LLDIVASALSFLVAMRIYDAIKGIDAERVTDYYALLGVTLIVIMFCRRFLRDQLHLHVRPFWKQVLAVVQLMAFSFGLMTVFLFLYDIEFVSRLIFVGFAIGNGLLLIVLRGFLVWWYFHRRQESAENFLRVLVIGSGRRAHRLESLLNRNSEWGVHVIGFLDPDDPNLFNRRKTDKVLGHVDDISYILANNVIDEVIIAVPRRMLGNLQAIIDVCQEEGVQLRFMADIYDIEAARIGLSFVGKVPLLSFEPVARDERALLMKRFMDLTLTILALPLLVPIFALVALIIKLDSPGPAFFMQERVGLHKRRFKMFKFRSMVVDAEARMKEIEHLNEADGPNFKIADDPRMTRVGKFIRKTSIDELPQLINVLIGDMSLVGPRPMSVRDVELFDKGVQRKRFSVRPGITCLWQISGRSDLSFDDWLELDLEYIDGWSLGLDFKILVMTVPTVLKGSGAV